MNVFEIGKLDLRILQHIPQPSINKKKSFIQVGRSWCCRASKKALPQSPQIMESLKQQTSLVNKNKIRMGLFWPTCPMTHFFKAVACPFLEQLYFVGVPPASKPQIGTLVSAPRKCIAIGGHRRNLQCLISCCEGHPCTPKIWCAANACQAYVEHDRHVCVQSRPSTGHPSNYISHAKHTLNRNMSSSLQNRPYMTCHLTFQQTLSESDQGYKSQPVGFPIGFRRIPNRIPSDSSSDSVGFLIGFRRIPSDS